jgi:hypothetical protein
MPASSRARWIAFVVLDLGSTTPFSKRITEFSETIARSANCWRVHPRKARAARTLRGVGYHWKGIFYRGRGKTHLERTAGRPPQSDCGRVCELIQALRPGSPAAAVRHQ